MQNPPTRFNKALSITRLFNTKNSKSIQQRVLFKNTLPFPPRFDSWAPNNPTADRPRTGLCSHPRLDGASPPPPPPPPWVLRRWLSLNLGCWRKPSGHVFVKSQWLPIGIEKHKHNTSRRFGQKKLELLPES